MKAYLFKHDLTVKELASDLGISPSYLYQLLRKERRPSLELALKIQQYTRGEVSVTDLIEGKDNVDVDISSDHQNALMNLIETKLESIEQRLKSLEEKIPKI